MSNKVEIKFKSLPELESFARTCVASYSLQLNPSLDEISDIKTAVSEAITNCIVHAYPKKEGEILLCMEIIDDTLKLSITDFGVGIKNIEQAMTPFYTTKPEEERSGMGFTVMDSFMDSLTVKNNSSKGLTIEMTKKVSKSSKMVV